MIVLTGGGTGGHLNIVRCLLESATKKGIECIYIGSQSGQDRAWFEKETRFKEKYFLSSSGVVNQSKFGKVKALAHIFSLAFECKQIFKKHSVKAVFSVGGYSAAPASFGAIFSHLPLFIHEQNSKSGSLNLLLKPFAKDYFTAFSKTYCPYPVSEKFFKHTRKRENLQNILFLGGSQGAHFINTLALNLAPALNEKGIKIIHQCGKKDLELCQKTYANLGINADVFDFSENLELKMQEADLAVSRAGASTLFELCANALPSIFIPYPHAARNHQFFNAFFLKNKNLCEIFLEQNLRQEEFLKSIFRLNLSYISERLPKEVEQNGSDTLLELAFKKIKA